MRAPTSAIRARSPSRGRAFAPAISRAACSLPYNNLFDAATGTMKSLDDLRAAFSGAGVKLDAPIVTSCGSGVSAAVLTLALYRLGVENPALYDGSWTEWGAADGPPVATGPA